MNVGLVIVLVGVASPECRGYGQSADGDPFGEDAKTVMKDDAVADERSEESQCARALVDSLASRNKAPILVKGRFGRIPVFSDEFDWEDQVRVVNLVRYIDGKMTPEVWEELVRHGDDARYCLTRNRGNSPTGEAFNVRLGEICGHMAWVELIGPVEGCIPKGVRFTSGVDFRKFLAWRKDRADKPVHFLQREVCQTALSALEHEDGGPEHLRKEATQRLTALVEEIAQKPKFSSQCYGEIDLYSRERAAKLLREVKGAK